jgi:predicted Rossmann-fold nucleotide-binding protein
VQSEVDQCCRCRGARNPWVVGSSPIPTWFYGHEPPDVFASAIAKYFSNALREDVLLRRARGGIVCLLGAAGTVQEIFQAVTPNNYGDRATQTPMILVGVQHWSEKVPVWDVLQRLASGRAMRLLDLLGRLDQGGRQAGQRRLEAYYLAVAEI